MNLKNRSTYNNVGDVGDIKTSSSHSSGDEDRCTAGPEGMQGSLSLTLSTVTVNGGGVVSLSTEEVAEHVGHSLGLDKDEDETSGLFGEEQVEQERSLVVVVDVLDSLRDVLGSRTDSTDREEDVVLQEGSGEHLYLPGEGGGEHESLSVVHAGHVDTLDNLSDLRLETHVEHSVGFVKDEVLDVGERDLASVNQVDQSTWSGREQITASVERSDLRADIGTTVDDGRSDPRSVGELPGFVVYLRDQFSSRGEDETSRVSLSPGRVAAVAGLGRGRGANAKHGVEDGEEETGRLSGTGLCTGHQVSAASDDGDRVLLDWGGGLVSGELDILEQTRVDGRVGFGEDGARLGDTLTGGLDRDVGVLVKVDTGRLGGQLFGSIER